MTTTNEAMTRMNALSAEHSALAHQVRTMPTNGDENFALYCAALAALRACTDAMRALAEAHS